MDPLTDDQRSRLRDALESLSRELADAHASSADAAAPVDLDEPIGRVSRVDAIQQQKMVEANRAAVSRRRQQVRAALRRFQDDEYGLCVDCGEEVGFRRLEARPEAPFCIECQGRRERD